MTVPPAGLSKNIFTPKINRIRELIYVKSILLFISISVIKIRSNALIKGYCGSVFCCNV